MYQFATIRTYIYYTTNITNTKTFKMYLSLSKRRPDYELFWDICNAPIAGIRINFYTHKHSHDSSSLNIGTLGHAPVARNRYDIYT